MTCGDFLTLATGDRDWQALTRAERAAMLLHLRTCSRCLVFGSLAAAAAEAEDSAFVAQAVAVGMRQAQADRMAQDPEVV